MNIFFKHTETRPMGHSSLFADRIYDFENIKDYKKLQKAVTEFKDELLHNIGIDVMIKREAKYHK